MSNAGPNSLSRSVGNGGAGDSATSAAACAFAADLFVVIVVLVFALVYVVWTTRRCLFAGLEFNRRCEVEVQPAAVSAQMLPAFGVLDLFVSSWKKTTVYQTCTTYNGQHKLT